MANQTTGRRELLFRVFPACSLCIGFSTIAFSNVSGQESQLILLGSFPKFAACYIVKGIVAFAIQILIGEVRHIRIAVVIERQAKDLLSIVCVEQI